MAAVHQGPLQALNGTGENGYFSYRRGVGSGNGKRKSAVELLEETKPLYVKSCSKNDEWTKRDRNNDRDNYQSSFQSHGLASCPPPEGVAGTRASHYQCCQSHQRPNPSHHHHHQSYQPSKSPRSSFSPFSFPENCERKTSHHNHHKSPEELQNQLRRLLNADSKENLSNDQDWNVNYNGEDQVSEMGEGGFRRSRSRESNGSSLANNDGRLISPPPGFNDRDDSGERGLYSNSIDGASSTAFRALPGSKSLPDLAPDGPSGHDGGGYGNEEGGNGRRGKWSSHCISDRVYCLRRRRWSDEDRNTLKAFSNREESDDYDSYNSSDRSKNERDLRELIKSTSFSCKGSEKSQTRDYWRRSSLGDLKLSSSGGDSGEGKGKSKRWGYEEIPYSLIISGDKGERFPLAFGAPPSPRAGGRTCKSDTVFPPEGNPPEGEASQREGRVSRGKKGGNASATAKSPRLAWPPPNGPAWGPDSPLPLPQELIEFFQYLGLTCSEYESLTSGEWRERNGDITERVAQNAAASWFQSDSSSASHVSSQGSTGTGSTGASSPSKRKVQQQQSHHNHHQRSKSLNLLPWKKKNWDRDDGPAGRRATSIVESNARVIKWLCNCSKNKII